MVKLNQVGPCHGHELKSKMVFNGFAEGEVKACWIQKMSDGRFGVMARYVNSFVTVYQNNDFYKVFKTEQDLHDAFDEVDIVSNVLPS